MAGERVYTASLVIIGNEILSGRTQDLNLAYAAKRLGARGIRVREVRVIPDECDAIVATVNELRPKFDYVFTTGGIGPTHDDITAECIARAFGVGLTLHPEAKRILEQHYRPEQINAARLRMATMPEGAELVRNAVSRVPGFRIDNVYVLAGVPEVMQAMIDGLVPNLAGGVPVRSRTVSCQLAEGVIAEGLEAIQRRYPDLDIGSYPAFRRSGYGVSLVLRGTDEARLAAAAAEVADLVRALGGTPQEEPPEA
jgi:molybdenum cofactor synthesis domain-containing protein